MFYSIFILSVVAAAEMFNSSFNQSVYLNITIASANITIASANITTASANITTVVVVVAKNSSSLKNENVSTQQLIANNYYCNQKISLYSKINKCSSHDYCCRINIFESQFNFECSSKNISNRCISLKKCKNACKSTIPSYGCIPSSFSEKTQFDTNNCYDNCFYNTYICPSVKITDSELKNYVPNLPEIILVSIIIFCFASCIVRYTVCSREDNDNISIRTNRKIYFSNV